MFKPVMALNMIRIFRILPLAVAKIAVKVWQSTAEDYVKFYAPFIKAVEAVKNFDNGDIKKVPIKDSECHPSSSEFLLLQQFLKEDGTSIPSNSALKRFDQIMVQLLGYYFPAEPT